MRYPGSPVCSRGSAHDYVVANIAKVLTETQGINEAVQAAAGLLDPSSLIQTAKLEQSKTFGKQNKVLDGSVYFTWIGKPPALPFQKDPLACQNRRGNSYNHYRKVYDISCICTFSPKEYLGIRSNNTPPLPQCSSETAPTQNAALTHVTQRDRNSPAPAGKATIANAKQS